MPASFELTQQSLAAITRIANSATEIQKGTRQGIEAHALAVKRGFQAKRGKSRTKGLRYDDPKRYGDTFTITFGLRYIVAWLEEGTRAHLVVPRGRGRAKLDRKTGEQVVSQLTARQKASGRGRKALSTPDGYRASAKVSGIQGGHYFERYVNGQSSAGDDRISEAVMRHMAGK